jgi:hypothetical protein
MGVRTALREACLSWGVVGLAIVALSGCGAELPPATPPTISEPEVEATPPPQLGDGQPPSGRCELPPSSHANCWKSEPELLDALEDAMTAATLAHPEYFDFESLRCGNCYYVKNVDGYYAELSRQLQLRGVCSLQDRDEITLKADNGWSEQFDILLGDDHIRRGAGSYLYTCTPSMF